MNASPAYVDLSLIVSATLVAIFAIHARRAIIAYGKHHDDRAAVELLVSLLKVVVCIGLTVSAWGLWAESSLYALVGLSMARGALLLAGFTLLLADRRHEREGEVKGEPSS